LVFCSLGFLRLQAADSPLKVLDWRAGEVAIWQAEWEAGRPIP